MREDRARCRQRGRRQEKKQLKTPREGEEIIDRVRTWGAGRCRRGWNWNKTVIFFSFRKIPNVNFQSRKNPLII